MPVSCRCAGKVMVIRFRGEHRPDELHEALRACAREDAGPSEAVLVDIVASETIPRQSSDELRALVAAIVGLSGRGGRLALVGETDLQFGLMRLAGSYAELDGIEVAAFRAVDEALAWLGQRS